MRCRQLVLTTLVPREAQLQVIVSRYLQSVPLDPFAPHPVDARLFAVFFCDYSISIGEVTASICASENLDKLLDTLVRRKMIRRCGRRRALTAPFVRTHLLLSSIPNALRQIVKFFLKNGMTGIRVKTSPFTAKRQVRVLHFAFDASQLTNSAASST